MKKALAILYSPKTLLDFVWYYYSYGRECAWDVLCIPCGGKVIIDEYCRNSGLFQRIYTTNISYNYLSKKNLAVLFVRMTGAWILRRKEEFVKRYLKKFVGELDYDLHLVPSDYSFLCGLLVSLSGEVETIILEEGLGDYTDRNKKFLPQYGLNLENISSYLFSFMGYGTGIGLVNYVNKPSTLCLKYAMHPEWMSYRNYKEIRVLKDLAVTDIGSWKKCLRKTFCINENQKFQGDIILFTAPLDEFCETLCQELVDDIIKYILCKYNPKKIFLKKHHRDKAKYNFPDKIVVGEIEKSIPGELILDLVQCEKHIYMYPSNMLVNYKEYSKCEVIKFQKLIDEKKGYEEKFVSYTKRIELPYECLNLI